MDDRKLVYYVRTVNPETGEGVVFYTGNDVARVGDLIQSESGQIRRVTHRAFVFEGDDVSDFLKAVLGECPVYRRGLT